MRARIDNSLAFRFLRHFFQDQFEELRREVFRKRIDCLVIEASFDFNFETSLSHVIFSMDTFVVVLSQLARYSCWQKINT